jgi:hypothetical protein
LESYGGIYIGRISGLTNVTNPTTGEFIYLGEANIVYGKVAVNDLWNTSDVLTSNPVNAVYSNGNCQIYQKP